MRYRSRWGQAIGIPIGLDVAVHWPAAASAGPPMLKSWLLVIAQTWTTARCLGLAWKTGSGDTSVFPIQIDCPPRGTKHHLFGYLPVFRGDHKVLAYGVMHPRPEVGTSFLLFVGNLRLLILNVPEIKCCSTAPTLRWCVILCGFSSPGIMLMVLVWWGILILHGFCISLTSTFANALCQNRCKTTLTF